MAQEATAVIDKNLYKKQGFVLARKFFEREEIQKIHSEAKQVFAAQIRRSNPDSPDLSSESNFERGMYDLFEKDFDRIVNCGKQIQHLVSLHRLGTDPRIIDALKCLGLSFPVISVRPVMYFNSRRLAKEEDYWRLAAHQDWRSSQGSLDAITIWIPLIDVDTSLGALEIIPESHKWGLLQSEKVSYYGKISQDLPASEFIPIEAQPGDALFFSSFLVHRSGTNSTNSIRWSCHLRYNNFAEPSFVERGFPHPYNYKPREDLITPDFPSKELLDKVFA